MKIALLSSLTVQTPPKKAGAISFIVHEIASGLGKKGHDVDVYALKGSTGGDTYNVIEIPPLDIIEHFQRDSHDIRADEIDRIILASRLVNLLRKKSYDIIHNHRWYNLIFYEYFNIDFSRIITTNHSPIGTNNFCKRLFIRYAHLPQISVSFNQQKGLEGYSFKANVYNGIQVNDYIFSPDCDQSSNDFMFFMSRASPEKGVLEALNVSERLHKQLILSLIKDEGSVDYYNTVLNSINPAYHILEEIVDTAHKSHIIGKSKVTLEPIQYEEPFGLVMIESMACGTPIVAYARGSVPEIIKDGETGFIVNPSDDDIRGNWIVKTTGIDGLCEAVERIYAMPDEEYRQMRRNCRAHVEKHFTVERMVDEYEKVYEAIVSR